MKIICLEKSDDWYLCLRLFVYKCLIVWYSNCKPVSLRTTSEAAFSEESCWPPAFTAFLSRLSNVSPSPGFQSQYPATLWQQPSPRECKVSLFQATQETKCKWTRTKAQRNGTHMLTGAPWLTALQPCCPLRLCAPPWRPLTAALAEHKPLYTIRYFKLSQVQHARGAAGWGFTMSIPLTLLVCGLPFCHTTLWFWDTKKPLATVCFLPFPSSSWRAQDLGTHFRRNIWPYWEKQSPL